MRSRVMRLHCGYIAASMLVATLMAAALAATLPTNAKGATARDPCFFEAAQPDKRIAACTALIRSGVAGITAALLSRAGAFGRKGDYEHAIEDATQVIALAPSPVAYYTRALAYHDGGDDMRAIADCDAALGMQPDNANALFVRGAAYQGLAAYSEAIRDFTKVLKLDPKRVDAQFSRGAARFSSGQYEGAVEDLSRAIEHGATDGTAFYLRSLAYQELGQNSRSRADMLEALRRDPDLADRPLGSGSPSTTGER